MIFEKKRIMLASNKFIQDSVSSEITDNNSSTQQTTENEENE